MDVIMRPIGIIHSPFQNKGRTPIQPSRSRVKGSVEVYPEFAAGLQDIEGFSHIILLYIFHRSSGYTLKVKPFLDDQMHGLFATRYPYRPNPIGLSIVELAARNDNILEIEGVDVLEGTPLLDIKPYVPEFDQRNTVSAGWFETRRKKE
ncbi:MAG TPA: tRNA (N6-threonylcarbamoyladenosine(37)-N6)-methyltransferase TrmO [Anaerolineales bacterium]|nr:tRNA (N6-threonylcarbamoyladenosine(37)-N6)-methyltransferase TrmO [Anaerolineales bacterium]